MPTFTINDFAKSFRGDIARPNRFDVKIFRPAGLNAFIASEQLTYRCESTNLPGRTFATMDQQTYGPTEKFPYQSTYQDIDLTFIVDDDMIQKRFFDQWMEFINPTKTYNFNYKSEYASQIIITQYDVKNFSTYEVTLFEAYPIAINQLDLDWSSDGYHKLTVTFAYTYWEGV